MIRLTTFALLFLGVTHLVPFVASAQSVFTERRGLIQQDGLNLNVYLHDFDRISVIAKRDIRRLVLQVACDSSELDQNVADHFTEFLLDEMQQLDDLDALVANLDVERCQTKEVILQLRSALTSDRESIAFNNATLNQEAARDKLSRDFQRYKYLDDAIDLLNRLGKFRRDLHQQHHQVFRGLSPSNQGDVQNQVQSWRKKLEPHLSIEAAIRKGQKPDPVVIRLLDIEHTK